MAGNGLGVSNVEDKMFDQGNRDGLDRVNTMLDEFTFLPRKPSPVSAGPRLRA